MKFGSLFAGIGGIDLGLERAGMKCAWQVEIDEFCNKVLNKHWPNVPKYGDIRNDGKENLKTVDLITGGFPCQDVSLAGRRKGLSGKRSTLWTEFYRVVCEIQPQWVFIENVRGLFSSDNGEFFRRILWGLAQQGYDAQWDVIPATAAGAPHLRERIFIVAYTKGICWDKKHNEIIDIFSKTRTDMAKHRGFARKVTWNGIRIDRQDATSYTRLFPEPIFSRMADGFPNWLDRLRTPGNAVVPQVAEFIGRIIMEANQES